MTIAAARYVLQNSGMSKDNSATRPRWTIEGPGFLMRGGGPPSTPTKTTYRTSGRQPKEPVGFPPVPAIDSGRRVRDFEAEMDAEALRRALRPGVPWRHVFAVVGMLALAFLVVWWVR